MKKTKSFSDWVTSLESPSSSVNVTEQTRKRTSSKRQTTKKTKVPPAKKSLSSLRTGSEVGGVNDTWTIKYAPKCLAELAVHKKKTQEVQQWLEFALSKNSHRPILLLTGPAGCGKTATIHALSHEMNYSILEWANPVDLTPVGIRDDKSRSNEYEFYESQIKQFTNFILRANKYPSLQFTQSVEEGGGVKKIVLIEEFPNAIVRDPSKLHHLLRTMKSFVYPLIFIVSECQYGAGTASRLFPSHMTSEQDIHTINFNPIAHTSMIKTLQRIADIEHKLSTQNGCSTKTTPTQYYLPNKEVIEAIADSSVGDIRNAINALQFAYLRDTIDLVYSEASKSKTKRGSRGGVAKDSSSEQLARSGIGGRDCSLFLYRALGKILYCKRIDTELSDIPSSDSLPPHLSQYNRQQLTIEPESVFDAVHMTSDLFTLYLHQNYLDFFEDIEDIAMAIDYLSIADLLVSVWSDTQVERISLERCSSSLSCRGLIFANNHVASSKWRPFYKPQWTTVYRQFVDNCKAARGLFLHLGASIHSHLWMPLELQTEILPFTAIINKPLRNWDQASILHTITNFRRAYGRRYDKLGETEVDEEIVVSDHTPSLPLETERNSTDIVQIETDIDDDVAMGTLSQMSGTVTLQEEFEDIGQFEDDDFW